MNPVAWLTADQWLRVAATLFVAGLLVALGRAVWELLAWARTIPEPQSAWPYEWLEHDGVCYRTPTLEEALSLTRFLAQIDALPETEEGAA